MAYEIEETPLWADIRDIVNSGRKPVRFEYRGMLHTEKEDIAVLKVMAFDVLRDYANNIGDHLQIEFKMPLGEYVARLYPFRTNLEFTIKRIDLQEQTTSRQKNTIITTERYKAVFLPSDNPVVAGTELELNDTESLNKVDIVNVKLQLLNRSLEPLRVKTVSGVYRKTTHKKLIHSVLGGESNKVLVDGKSSIDGIDIVEPDNTEQHEHIVLPDGMHITSIPTFLQEKMKGVYNAGIGTYLQQYNNQKLWFVYPVFNTKRFDTATEKAIIYAVPQGKMPGIDRSYRKDAGVLYIVATAAKKYQDSADTDFMNKGSGFRMADARSFMKKPVVLTEDGPVAERARLNHETVSESRKDGLNYAPVSSDGVSGNPYVEYSKVLSRAVARVDFVWENSDYELLYPGMPCKYVFMDKNKPVELKGIIVFVHALVSLQGQGISGNSYKNVCNVTILCEGKPVTRDTPSSQPYGVF